MIWPFKRKPRTALDVLKGAAVRCSSCGKRHKGLFDLACDAPDVWSAEITPRKNAELDLAGDFLGQDFCVLAGEHFMVRCVLEIPVHGLPTRFGFGCWGSLSEENFKRYLADFDDGLAEQEAPCWSWLCNRIAPLVGDESVGCYLHMQAGRKRPLLLVADEAHPLAVAQREGITPEQVLEIYKAHGHALTV